jgi:sec-independent protein translocase protein TatA
MPLGLHWPELIILVGVALLIFGPKRLPEMGSAMGKTIKEFQRSMREVTGGGEKQEVPAIPPATPEPTATVTPEPPAASATVAASETKAE